MKGTVTKLNKDRGFGFIRGIDGLSRFFHCKSVKPRVDFERLEEGESVEFTPEQNPGVGNGLRAEEVVRES